MSEENKNKSHRGILMVITIAIAVPMFYVLSIGPAAVIITKYPKCEHAFREFYFPLTWLCEHAPVGKLLQRYCELWVSP